MTDYAKDLLGGAVDYDALAAKHGGADYDPQKLDALADKYGGKDYAGEMFSATPGGAATSLPGRAQTIKAAQEQGAKLEDLPIANLDAGPSDPTTADFSTLTKAAMVDDPGARLKIFAQARFPKDANAAERYGMVGNEVVYIGDDGRLYRDTPAGKAGAATEFAAGTAGKGLPIAGSIAGGVVGGPPGMVGGAMAGEAARKIVGNLAFGEPQSAAGNAADIATEGLFSVGGIYGGKLFAKWLERNAARDIGKLDRATSDELGRKAQAEGVQLYPPQQTNLPSLKGRFEALARMPASGDAIEEGMKQQAEQANRAAYRFFNRVSPKEGIDDIGEAAKVAASKVIGMVAKERADAARPLYEKAFSTVADLTPESQPVLADLVQRPAMKDALKRAVTLAKNDGIDLADPANKLLGLHYAKLSLDDMIENAGRQGSGTTFKRGLLDIKNQLLGVMDSISPDYAQARQVFAHFSPNVDAIREGVVSRIADLPPERIGEASKMLFKPGMSPEVVKKTRGLFAQAGLEDDYNAMLRSYLQDAFERAGREFKTGGGLVGQAPGWRAAMMGDPAQKRVLMSAMTPEQWRAFSDMSDVFEAIGRVSGKGNSITMPMQEAAADLRRESGAGVIGNAARLASPHNIGARVGDWFAEARLGQHAEKMAEVMTSPEGMRKLKLLYQMDPRSKQYLAVAANIFGISIAPSIKPETVDRFTETIGGAATSMAQRSQLGAR